MIKREKKKQLNRYETKMIFRVVISTNLAFRDIVINFKSNVEREDSFKYAARLCLFADRVQLVSQLARK